MSVRLFDENFIDPDVVSNADVSSEQAAFPAMNAYNKQRRSKVYRSNGYWKVISGENTIIFRETTAVDLTATITAGEYTSTTSFLAAVKSALEVPGASTYTVSVDTTSGKIKIASNGAGGGGILELIWSDPGSLDIAAMLGFDTVDSTGALTYTADALRIHTEEWFLWDMGISSNPTGFIVVGPRNRPIKISPSATIKLQGNETNTWASPSYETTVPYDDRVFLVMDAAGLHTEALRYWRFQIIDKDNPNLYIEIGAIFLGSFYSTTRGQAQFPFGSAMVDRSSTVLSEGGQTFSDIREKTQSFDLSWTGLTLVELERLVRIFDVLGTSVPMFVAFDPDSWFSSDATYYVRYVKFASEPSYQLISPNNFSLNMNLLEQL
jgi:hypothetical protein